MNPVVGQVFEDTACKGEVLDLHVKCPFRSCCWTGELRDVEVRKKRENYFQLKSNCCPFEFWITIKHISYYTVSQVKHAGPC